MRLLLDTHTLIWAACDTKKIPSRVRMIIRDPNNRPFVSAVSYWEVSIKLALGKLVLKSLSPDELRIASLEMGFELLSLDSEDAATFHQLPRKAHKDPFDRMLAWQAIRGKYHLVSCDAGLRAYEPDGLMLLWG